MFSSLFSELWEPHTTAGDTATKPQESEVLFTVFWFDLIESELVGLECLLYFVLVA